MKAWMGDPQSYERILAAFYRGLFDAGLSVDVVAPDQLPDDAAAMAARWPVLVVPGLYVASEALLERLRRYAEAGGHLVLTPRTGYVDEDAVARHVVMPGALREAAGVSYLEFANLTNPVPVNGTIGGAATAWADGLVAEGADVLARYEHPHHGEFPAVTTHPHGPGRVTYVGTVPDRALSRALAEWLAETSLPADPWRSASAVRCTTADAGDAALRFVHNWSWEPADLALPAQARDLLSGDEVEVLQLGPWDVRVLVERAPANSPRTRAP